MTRAHLVKDRVNGGDGSQQRNEESEDDREQHRLHRERERNGESQEPSNHLDEHDAQNLSLSPCRRRDEAKNDASDGGEDGVLKNLEVDHKNDGCLARAHLHHGAVVVHAVVDHDLG